MKILFFIIFLLIVGAALFGLSKLISKAAYDKEKRYLHCRLVIAVFLTEFTLANVYTLPYALKVLNSIINSKTLASFFNYILPNRSYDLLYMLLSIIGLNLAITLLVLLAVHLTKYLFIDHTDFVDMEDYHGVQRVLHFPWLIVRKFYEYQDEKIKLNNRGFAIGIWAKGMKNAFLILWLLEILVMVYSILWGSEDWNATILSVSKAWYLLPMAGFLLAQQVQFFLEGNDTLEAGTFSSSDISEELVGNIEVLTQIYKETFKNSDVLLYSEKGDSQIKEREGLFSNDLENQQMADCKQADVLNVISNQLKECGIRQCGSYQNALIALLNGESINIRDYMSGEVLVYVAAYLNYYVSQGKTALVLCKNQDEVLHFRNALQRKMKVLNNLYSVWHLSTIEDADNNMPMSVLVCTYDAYLTHAVTEKRRDFINDLFCTVIANGMGLFSQDSVKIELLFNSLKSISKMQQYIMISDENNDALRTSLETSINHEVIPFSNDVRYPNTCIMVWKEESYYKLQRFIGVGSSMSQYMGTALPLALIAVKYDMPQVHIIADSSRGDNSYSDVQDQNSNEIFSYIGRNVNLNSVIRYEPEEVLNSQDLSIVILYDRDYNLFQALWEWLKYGGKNGALFHVISPSYMLREYFAANFSKKNLFLKNDEFNALVPNNTSMKRSQMAVVLVSLCDKGLTEEELLEKARKYKWNYDNIETILTECLKTVLKDEEIHNIYERFHFEEEKYFMGEKEGYVLRTRISMTDQIIRERLMDIISCSKLIYNDGQTMKLNCLRRNVYNYYLPGQYASFGGYRYKITSISKPGNVHAVQMNSQDEPQYYPISEFQFDGFKVEKACIDSGELEMNLCTASVTRHIYGYWSSNNGNRFADSANLMLNDLRNKDEAELTAVFDKVNILEIRFRKENDHTQQMALLLTYMLSEVSKTLFPENWQNIFAVTGSRWGENFILDLMNNGSESKLDHIIRSIIPCVCGTAQTNDNTIYIVECSSIEYGLVQTLQQKYIDVFTILQDYLDWYLNGNKETEDNAEILKGTYLNFGSDSVSDIFAPSELLHLLTKVTPKYAKAEQADVTDVSNLASICTFCGRPSLHIYKLSDGRMMCDYCHNHQITQRDEIRKLFKETVEFMEKGYDIKLRKNIHVRFQSAQEIRKAAGETENGRILGFYAVGKRELWLEARGPRTAMTSTLIHELTHCWQQDNLNIAALKRKCHKEETLRMILEGHAMYVEIETMREKSEFEYAESLLKNVTSSDDIYGKGYRWICEYLKTKELDGSHKTPFEAMKNLVDDIISGEVIVP